MRRFTEDKMKQAVLRVTAEGFSLNRVAKEDGLCKKTLKSYVDKYLSKVDDPGAEISFRPNYEINQVFTNDHEKVFEEYLVARDHDQHKITRDFVRKEAYNFATKCNVHVPKTWNVRKQAGLDWMYGYLNRHPKIKAIIVRNKKNKSLHHQTTDRMTVDENGLVSIEDIRIEKNFDFSSGDEFEVTEVLGAGDTAVLHSSDNRSGNSIDEYCNFAVKTEIGNPFCCDNNYLSEVSVKTTTDEFIENITVAYEAIAKNGYVDAERVYSLGEIALEVNDPISRNLLVTACCFMNAAGNSLPPFFIFPSEKKFRPSMLQGLSGGVDGTTQPEGRLDEKGFLLVLKHFQRFVKATPENRIVLLMDADECHITINAIDFSQQSGIELVTLPPPYSPNIQPAASHIFPKIKYLFNLCVDQFSATNSTSFSPQHIAMLFCRIHPIAFSNENVNRSFIENGIFPLNEYIFQKKDLLKAKKEPCELPVELSAEISLDFPDTRDQEDPLSDYEDVMDANCRDLAGGDTLFESESKFNVSIMSAETKELFGRTPMREFHGNLLQAYNILELHGGLKPETIYNLDELIIRICALKSNCSKSCVSVCCYVNALGRSLPPFMVYPESDYSPAMLAGGIPGMRGVASPDGRIDNAIFFQMLEYFQQCVKSTPSNRVVLVLDSKDYHISLQTIDFCDANGIIMVTVPPYVSEPVQPLEKTSFRMLPSDFQHECAAYIRAGHATDISMFDIASLLSKTFVRSFMPENIVSGFEMSGIWPLNEDMFARDVACPSYPEGAKTVIDTSEPVLNDDSNEDDDGGGGSELDSDSDMSFSLPDNDVVHFFNNIENFFSSSNDEDEKKSLEERIFVLAEVRLETSRVITNVILFVNAVGMLLPPYLIYWTDLNDILLESSLGIRGCRCEKNVVDARTLQESINHFLEYSHASKDCKTMLLLEDPDGSRLTESITKLGENFNIVFAKFPVSDVERLHPLENCFMKLLKQRFEDVQANTSTQLVSINDIVDFLELTFLELFNLDEIVTKFRESGICYLKSIDEFVLVDEESGDERNMIGQKVKVNVNVFKDAHRVKSGLENYEDFIIEEEIEVAVDKEELPGLGTNGSSIMFLCGNCDLEFATESGLEAHEKESSCRYCEMVCCSRTSRDVHELGHMNGALHCCPYCDKECTSRTALIQHRRKHKR